MFLRVSLFYFLTWFFLMLLGGIQQEIDLFPPEIGLPQWAPGIAALVMLLIFRKDNFKLSFFDKTILASRYLSALLPLGIGVLVYLLRFIFPFEATAPEGIFENLSLVLIWMPLGALGEEIGWRGYLHKKLNGKMRGLVSSVLVGILWLPIHVHFLGEGPLFIFLLAIWFIAQSIVMYAILYDIEFNIVIATIYHWAINLVSLLVLDITYNTSFWMLNSLIWVVVAAFVLFKNKELFLGRPLA